MQIGFGGRGFCRDLSLREYQGQLYELVAEQEKGIDRHQGEGTDRVRPEQIGFESG